VAIAFSPRMRAVLAEARRFAQKFGAQPSLVHVGARTAENEQELQAVISELNLAADTPANWLAGDDPASALLTWVEREKVDLLIAGALERERAGRNFLGIVARELLRHAHCSLLLFTQPSIEPRAFGTIVVVTDFSESAAAAFDAALSLAEREHAKMLHVVTVFSPLKAMHKELTGADSAQTQPENAQARLDEFVASAKGSPVTVETRVIESTTGVAVSEFTKSVEANLLVLPARTHQDGTPILPAYMDWALQVIPCNVWVVKSS
jgi:nucleotide-binding universal stress UspA family protein